MIQKKTTEKYFFDLFLENNTLQNRTATYVTSSNMWVFMCGNPVVLPGLLLNVVYKLWKLYSWNFTANSSNAHSNVKPFAEK